MLLLDTTVVSELRKASVGKAHANVVRWFTSADARTFYLSVVTLTELEIGILRLARRDAAQAAILRDWLQNRVIPEFADRTLAIDSAVALRCARLHVPDPKPELDAYIAATALVHGMAVVTRNVADFAEFGVAVIDPWADMPADLQ